MPIDIISPTLDRLILNYAVLPWNNRCAKCGRRAHFRCDQCGQAFCAEHSKVGHNLQVRCAACGASA